MSANDDLLTWLHAIYDERERTALAAGGHSGHWRAEHTPGGTHKVVDALGYSVVEHADVDSEPWFTTPHIADNDPAGTLGDLDAKRRILDEILKYEAAIDGEWGDGHTAEEIAAGECPERHPDNIPAFRAMALPFASRPGYRPEWAPDA